MADITLAAAGSLQIAAEKVNVYDQLTLPAGVAITMGQVITINSSTGKWQLGDADTAGSIPQQCFMALRDAGIGEALTGSRSCVAFGFDISQNFGVSVFLSNTAGGIADAAGTNSVIVGMVVPLFANGQTAEKGIFFKP